RTRGPRRGARGARPRPIPRPPSRPGTCSPPIIGGMADRPAVPRFQAFAGAGAGVLAFAPILPQRGQDDPATGELPSNGYRRTAGLLGGEQSVGPAPLGEPTAVDPARRNRAPDQHPVAEPKASALT